MGRAGCAVWHFGARHVGISTCCFGEEAVLDLPAAIVDDAQRYIGGDLDLGLRRGGLWFGFGWLDAG